MYYFQTLNFQEGKKGVGGGDGNLMNWLNNCLHE